MGPAAAGPATAGDSSVSARPASVRLDQLEPHPGNVRQQLGDLTELALSIREHGIIQPLVVQPLPDDRYRLVTGHRRAAASALAGRTTVPVVVRDDLDAPAVLAVMLVENMQRQSLNPLEEAHALQSLRNLSGCTQADLARSVGRSIAWVSMRLSLLELDEDEAAEIVAEHGIVEAQQLVQERRRADRDGAKRDRGWDRSPWHIGKDHPLAAAATDLCDQSDHNLRRRLRGTGCGVCWEQVIRADERRLLTKQSPPCTQRRCRGSMTWPSNVSAREIAA